MSRPIGVWSYRRETPLPAQRIAIDDGSKPERTNNEATTMNRADLPRVVPEPPTESFTKIALMAGGVYIVTRESHRLAVYLPDYFPSAWHVANHVLAELRQSEADSRDVAIWFDGRLLAAIHQSWDEPSADDRDGFAIVYFGDDGSDIVDYATGADDKPTGIPGWPTRDQWLADGAGKIILRPECGA